MRRVRATVGAVVLALAVAGCGAASEDYEVDGIDGLEIPTPSPDPYDFVAVINNPWLPFAQGNSWTYDVDAGVQSGRETVTVEPSNLRLDGVAVTTVRTETLLGQGPATEITDYYAQDRDGNVWWFGRAGVWDVTVAGAEAGLAMPADPRGGDGWRRGYLEGIAEERATVTGVDSDSVVLLVEDDTSPGIVVEHEYKAGVGLERTFRVEGPPLSSVLVSGP